jgi:periplasmic divalent cation tolerance protein
MVTSMILVYIVTKDTKESENIGKLLLKKRLIACVNIIPSVQSMSLWPPHAGTIENTNESILLCKTLADRWDDIEREVKKIHSYQNPSIFAMPVAHVSDNYLSWLEEEIR